jgi:hypothetical protein
MRRGGRVKSQFRKSGRMLACKSRRKNERKRETAVGVEKSRKTFSLKLDWQLRQEEHSVA